MKEKWHSGPPPSAGWWPASYSRCPDVYRWWNGERWSEVAHSQDTLTRVVMAANTHPDTYFYVEWASRPKSWPSRSLT